VVINLIPANAFGDEGVLHPAILGCAPARSSLRGLAVAARRLTALRKDSAIHFSRLPRGQRNRVSRRNALAEISSPLRNHAVARTRKFPALPENSADLAGIRLTVCVSKRRAKKNLAPASGPQSPLGAASGLIAQHVRDVGVAGSNPATPTSFLNIAMLTGPDMGHETHAGLMLGALSMARLGFAREAVNADDRRQVASSV
jgi:hypothetical protein